MTDFVTQIRHQNTDYIVRSLLDVDFYKFTMGYFIHKNYSGKNVKFKLINRDKSVPLAKIIPEQALRDQLNHVRTLAFRRTDLYYLRGMDVYGANMFDEEYMTFLKSMQYSDFTLKTVGDQFDLTFEGPWEVVTFWETVALAIISELYYRELMKKMSDTELSIMYARATDKLYNKLTKIAETGAKVADFGQRRRHSFLWQQHAISMAKDILGDNFVGTSNTWLAFNQDLVPIGTNAHELPMVITALAEGDEAKRDAQYKVIREWGDLYGNGLRIVLPDTYGTNQFFDNIPSDLASEVAALWRGMRQDSGDPVEEAETYIKWLNDFGVKDTSSHVNIFSDGLDADSIVDLYNTFEGRLTTPFGWGTKLTNDFAGCTDDPLFRPFSMVIKVTEAEGNPAVKLSNNVNKATGDPDAVKDYIRIFGEEGRGSQEVEV